MVESTLFGTGKSGWFCGAGLLLLLFLSLELVQMSYSIENRPSPWFLARLLRQLVCIWRNMLPWGSGLLCVAGDVGSLMHRPLSWGDDQQNIPVSALRGYYPTLPYSTHQMLLMTSPAIYIGHTQSNQTLNISVVIWQILESSYRPTLKIRKKLYLKNQGLIDNLWSIQHAEKVNLYS